MFHNQALKECSDLCNKTNKCTCIKYVVGVGVSKCFETSSIERQKTAVRECVRCAWEQGTSPLSMPSGAALWTLVVAQHQYLSPRVTSHLQFQHGRKTGADSKHQILRETRQIWSGDFWNVTTCIRKWGHESCEVFWVTHTLQERQNITWRRQEVRATFHDLKTQKCGNNSVSCAWESLENH
jgi:hypothetical protein